MSPLNPKRNTNQGPNQSRLSRFSIRNFKAFGDQYGEDITIPIRPITLIFGQNSGGKSSIIHSLLYMHQIRTAKAQVNLHDISYTTLGGASADLGGYPHYLHKHDPDRQLKIELHFEKQHYSQRFSQYVTQTASTQVILERQQERDTTFPQLSTIFALYDEPLYQKTFNLHRLERYEIGSTQTSVLYHQIFVEQLHPVFDAVLNDFEYFYRDAFTSEDVINDVNKMFTTCRTSQLQTFAERMIDQVNAFLRESITKSETNPFFDNRLHSARNTASDYDTIGAITDAFERLIRSKACHVCVFELLTASSNLTELIDVYGTNTAKRSIDDIDIVWEHVESSGYMYREMFSLKTISQSLSEATCDDFFTNLRYIGPLRKIPNRFFNELFYGSTSESDGSTAWEILALYPSLLQIINTKIQALQMNYLLQSNITADSYMFSKAVVDTYLLKVETFSAERDGDPRSLLEEFLNNRTTPTMRLFVELLDLHSNTVVSHRDVGIGISQVLPILVECYSQRNTTICIEQPELHLHPKLQGDLADLFIETSTRSDQDNTYIIETHSEAIIRRLMRRIREKVISKEDVAILYVEAGPNGSTVTHINLDDEGDLIDEWPNGFFEEGFRDNIAGR